MASSFVPSTVVEISPAVELPPDTPFTCQVTAVFVVPVTVAVNGCVASVASVIVEGEIETFTCADRLWLKPPTRPNINASVARLPCTECPGNRFRKFLSNIVPPCLRFSFVHELLKSAVNPACLTGFELLRLEDFLLFLFISIYFGNKIRTASSACQAFFLVFWRCKVNALGFRGQSAAVAFLSERRFFGSR